MLCSKQFSTTNTLGLDLYKALFNKHNEIANENINMRAPRIEPSGIRVKIPIHSFIANPIFTRCFRFEK